MSLRNLAPTDCSASLGQGWNQSSTVQLMSAGKRLARVLMSSPTGEKHSTTCRLRFTVSMNHFQHVFLSTVRPAALTRPPMALTMVSISSGAKRSGMLPLASRSFMGTRKRSLTICESVKRNMTPSSLTPAMLYIFLRSSLRSPRP